MGRRLLASVVVVATLAAPALVTLCQVLCAHEEHLAPRFRSGQAAQVAQVPAASTPVRHPHSCHQAPPAPTAAFALQAVPHVCGHASESPAGVQQSAQAVSPPLPVVATAAFVATASPIARAFAADVQHSPPGSFQAVAQLRV
jgi:hypothetical protein